MTPEQRAEVSIQARLELARRAAKEKDILTWGWCMFPHKFSVPFCQALHGYFVSIRNLEFTSTEAPRGSAKTTIKCFLIPIFQALEEPETFRHYLNVQATEEKALPVNRSIKNELETNDLLRRAYGDVSGERWTDGQFVLKSGVVFSCIGAGQSVRGVNYNNVRPDYIIVDDLYDEEDINRSESTKTKNAWFWGSLYPALIQHGRKSMHVQGTAINKVDLLEELKGKPDVVSKSFKTVIDFDRKELLWPEQKTFDQVMKDMRNMPLVIWEREYQNIRRDDASSIIKLAWLSSWEYDPVEFYRGIRNGVNFVSGVKIGNDPSIGKKTENDFTATALVIATTTPDGGQDFWIEALREEKASMQGRIDTLKEVVSLVRPDAGQPTINVEGIAGFNDYADEVARRVLVPVNRITRVLDKITNLENKSVHFQNGRVHINKNIPVELKNRLIEQLTNNYPPHDDLRDAVFLTLDATVNIWDHI